MRRLDLGEERQRGVPKNASAVNKFHLTEFI